MIAKFVISFCLAVLFLLGGCNASNNADAPVALASEVSILDVAFQAHKAINSGDLENLTNLIDFPLFIRSHEWASTSGSFELIRPIDRVIKTQASLLSSTDLGQVRLDSNPDDGGVILYEDVRENLEGSAYDWSDLTIIVYARGFGDVEHIVLLGIDKRGGKIRAIYYN